MKIAPNTMIPSKKQPNIHYKWLLVKSFLLRKREATLNRL